MKGMERGYLNSSPLEAFILATIIHTTFRMTRKNRIGKPIIIKHKGITSIIYRRTDSSKFIDRFPFWSTQVESSFLDSQQMSGPIIPPKGKKKPANAER